MQIGRASLGQNYPVLLPFWSATFLVHSGVRMIDEDAFIAANEGHIHIDCVGV